MSLEDLQYEYENNHREWSEGELDRKIIEVAFNDTKFIEIMDGWISERIDTYDLEKVEPLRERIEELSGKPDEEYFPVFRPTTKFLDGDYNNLRKKKNQYWEIIERLFFSLYMEGFTEALNNFEYQWMFTGKRIAYEDYEPVNWLGAKNLCVYLFTEVLPSKQYGLYFDKNLPKKVTDIFGIKNVRSVIQNNFRTKERKPKGYEVIDSLVQIAFDEELFYEKYPQTKPA